MYKFDHIGLVVKDIESIEKFIDTTGIGTITRAGENAKTFLHLGTLSIDLFESMPDTLLVNDAIKRDGEGVHHIAITVEDIDKTIEALEAGGAKLLFKQDISHGVTMKSGKIAFLGIPCMGLTFRIEADRRMNRFVL